MKSRAAWTAPGAIILKNINLAIQAESLEGRVVVGDESAAFGGERRRSPHRRGGFDFDQLRFDVVGGLTGVLGHEAASSSILLRCCVITAHH
jgi:hypothetical protein